MTLKNLVNYLADRHWSERDTKTLRDLLTECVRSLRLIPTRTIEYQKIQETISIAVMPWYFLRLAPDSDMQYLFSDFLDEKVHKDTLKTSSSSTARALERQMCSLTIEEESYPSQWYEGDPCS